MGEEDLKSLFEVADRMNASDEQLRCHLDEPQACLVQRLIARDIPCMEADSIFRYYKLDYMGAAEFEHGIIKQAIYEACKVCKKEKWLVKDIYVGPEITVHYVGPEVRFKFACEFLGTQLIEDRTDRHMACPRLKEGTYLREAYLCQDKWYARLTGWWRLDLDYQFFFFKTADEAKRCLETLQTTDYKALWG